ncbi:hypothetical protein [Nibricoccus sp. IMCC34717]|uniref:hypothetical protein n=1 Tax=Nibricoccus sp. IMCC34717 TaxID=3034021 RepID=UPI00384FF869
MPALTLAPALSFVSALSQIPPTAPFRTWLRATGNKLRPPRYLPFAPRIQSAQNAVLASGSVRLDQRASVLLEERPGPVPTIVLGGFVPDATEQVFLLRNFFLRRGSVYYVNLSSTGFDLDLFFALLDDLVADLEARHGHPPAVFAVSFGAGLILEWLRQRRVAGRTVPLQGLCLVSPVACNEDLIAPHETKPSTLLGRAIFPYMGDKPIAESQIERSRSIFAKMFEAGAQNKSAIGTLLSPGELTHLHRAVLGTIRNVTFQGACERIRALRRMENPLNYFSPGNLPLSEAPTTILYSEKEDSVLTATSPTRFALQTGHTAYFPNSEFTVVTNPGRTPVQHASLVFHCHCFLPRLARHYRRIFQRLNARPLAA